MHILEADCVKTYALKIDATTGEILCNYSQGAVDPGVEVDRLCREFAATHRCSYQEAFQAVTTDPVNWDVVRAYAMS